MLKIGLTGGIGSGKTQITTLFAQLGVPVFDSDSAARRLIDTDPRIKASIIEAFGKEAYLPDNQGLDRKKIGQLVFQDTSALQVLNQITHPPVIKAAKDWMESQAIAFKLKKEKWAQDKRINNAGFRQSGLPAPTLLPPIGYVVKEAALLFESGSDKYLDFILGVYANANIRINRIVTRDQLSWASAENRIQKQMNEEQKMALCDGLIFNNGKELLWPQILAWHRQFQQREFPEEFNPDKAPKS